MVITISQCSYVLNLPCLMYLRLHNKFTKIEMSEDQTDSQQPSDH